MPDALWYAGVCDRMLAKVAWWAANWQAGEVAATRQYLSTALQLEDRVTRRALKIGWTRAELEHMVRLLDAVKPNWILTADLKNVLTHFDKARLLPGNERAIPMVSYEEDPKEILTALLQARDGQSKPAPVAEPKPGERLWG